MRVTNLLLNNNIFIRKLHETITTVGTWNVQILRQLGKLEILTNELSLYNKWDMVELSEIRLIGTGLLTMNDCHKLYFNGREKYHESAGFIVRMEMQIMSSIMRLYILSNNINNK